MTGDELERAIDFILKSQAGAEARSERNEEQLSRLAEQVEQLRQQSADSLQRHDAMEEAHTNFVRAMTQHLGTQDQINKSLRETDARLVRLITSLGETVRSSMESSRMSDESLSAAMAELAARQGQTEATVDRLSLKVEALAEQTAGTDRRLDALIKIVEEQRGGGQ